MKKTHEPFIPKPETVAIISQLAEQISPDSSNLQEWYQSYTKNHIQRISFDYDLVACHIKPGCSIFEVGAIPLLLTVPLHESGFHVTGIDLCPDRFVSAIDNLNLTVLGCDIEIQPIPVEDNTFDVVVFNEIFEHLRINLIFTMRQILRVLKPGGRLFLSTPNLRSLVLCHS